MYRKSRVSLQSSGLIFWTIYSKCYAENIDSVDPMNEPLITDVIRQI